MFLKEFEGSSLLVKYGIPVPAGILLEREIFDDEKKLEEAVLGFAEGKKKGFAVKAQVLKGGRGKSGLILFAEKDDLLDKVMELKRRLEEGAGGADGETEILVQERFSVEKEFYLAVVVDRHKKCPKVVFSLSGGVDVESLMSVQNASHTSVLQSGGQKESHTSVLQSGGQKESHTSVLQSGGQKESHTSEELRASEAVSSDAGELRAFAAELGRDVMHTSMLQSEAQNASHTSKELRTFEAETNNVGRQRAFEVVVVKLVELFVNEDAVLAEINPLVLTGEGEIVALDAKVILDDSALDRHPDFADLRGRELSATEAGALEHGLSYVELEGDIAIVGNGAGLVMATLDSLAQKGGKPANFCDIGGGATSEMMKVALKTVMSKININGLFINIFGGITRCDEIARGIVEYVGETGVSVPMVVRITGTNEDEAKEILRGATKYNDGARAIEAFTFFDEAVAAAAKLSK